MVLHIVQLRLERLDLERLLEIVLEAPDLRAAMADAKALQERWRTEAASLRLPRGEEQKR